MLVPIGTRVSVDRRDQLYALADNMNITPATLLRNLVDSYLDGGDGHVGGIAGLLRTTHEDTTRALVLVRFLAESVDKESTDVLLEQTDTYLKRRRQKRFRNVSET